VRKRPTSNRRRQPRADMSAPWWLAGGEEECPHCEQSYAYEAEVVCTDCDLPMCPVCAVRIAKRRVCPACTREGEG
jgi:hypothetical protein